MPSGRGGSTKLEKIIKGVDMNIIFIFEIAIISRILRLVFANVYFETEDVINTFLRNL